MGSRQPIAAMVAVLAGVGAGVTSSGCGGDDDRGPMASIETVPTTRGGVPEERRKTTPEPSRGRRRERKSTEDNPTSLQGSIGRAVARMPPAKRAALSRKVARAVMSRYGFLSAKLTVTSSGKGVRASIGRSEACTATSRTEAAVASTLREAAPWLESIEIVARTGEPLSQYMAGRCRAAALPGGRGRTVLRRRGTRMATIGTFTVRSRRWAIDYVNGGSALSVFVLRNGGPTELSVRSTRRGPGRAIFTKPGTYKLRIFAVGEWTVRVRDGA